MPSSAASASATPRLATPVDFAAVLALNAGSVQFLSPLDAERLRRLDAQAERHWVVEDADRVLAFMLVFREGADYDSVNYRWFAARYPRFLYVDRIVVSPSARGRGIAAGLYRQAFAHAAASGMPWVAAEYDIAPPNPVSARFHASFGFREVGRQAVAGGSKSVTLQLAPVVDAAG